MYGCVIIILLTSATAPGAPPQNVVGQSTVIGSIDLSWSPPPSNRQFGIIVRYFVLYQKEGSDDNPIGRNVFNLDTTISGLESNVTYLVTIAAVNSAGISLFPSSILITTIPNREYSLCQSNCDHTTLIHTILYA